MAYDSRVMISLAGLNDLSVGTGTPAARMKKVPSNIVKKRSRELTTVFEAFTPYVGMEGKTERIWITEFASDEIHLVSWNLRFFLPLVPPALQLNLFLFCNSLTLQLCVKYDYNCCNVCPKVGHTKGYVQVLVIGSDSLLGTSAIVKITSVGRWSVFGEVIETLREQDHVKYYLKSSSVENICSPCYEQTKSCESSSCACLEEGCGEKLSSKEEHLATEPNIRQRKQICNTQNQAVTLELEHPGSAKVASLVDGALVAGIILSLVTIITLFLYVGLGKSDTKPLWH